VKEGLERWANKTYLWLGNKEEISKEQMEDPTWEEYRARAIERNRGGIWVIKKDMLLRIRRRKRGREDIQLVVLEKM